jgi:hypothetical protein
MRALKNGSQNKAPSASKGFSSLDLPSTRQEENKDKTSKKGRVAGGSFLKDLCGSDSENADEESLKEVDFDLPLTLTEVIYRNNQEYILLQFVDGDTENSFNWSVARKAFITLLLCLMTLFIGLATTVYSIQQWNRQDGGRIWSTD